MRIGVDLGGTKIEIVALDERGQELLRRRIPTPRSSYAEVIHTIAKLVSEVEDELGQHGTVGLAIPGTISPVTGLVKNANTTKLIGHPLDRDLQNAIGREVRVANDANCFAISEARDGAAAGCEIVFGIIAGTGIGGGICVAGRPLTGAHAISGEWGHNPLPAPTSEEVVAAPKCYCGKHGCIESWISGPALSSLFEQTTGRALSPSEIADSAGHGNEEAHRAMQQFYNRFARAIASVVNILDPDAIVLGGGLSNIASLSEELGPRVQALAFFPEGPIRIVKNMHGDSSGVRGAAWLWREGDKAGLPT